MISRHRLVLILFLSLVLTVSATADEQCLANTGTDCNCTSDNDPPPPLDTFFYLEGDYPVNGSGDSFNITTQVFNGQVIWQLVFEPVVYPALGDEVNEENYARLQAIQQALGSGALTQLRVELRDNFNGDSTFLGMVDGEPTETLDRAAARDALFADDVKFSTGGALWAVAFVDALGYQDVPMLLHAYADAPPPAGGGGGGNPGQEWASCAVIGTSCMQFPPTLPCKKYSATNRVKITCPNGNNYSIPFWQLWASWSFWRSLLCLCTFEWEHNPQVQHGTCNWYRPWYAPPWSDERRCGCT